MAEKEQLIKEKFEYSGLCDFAGFYSFANYWLKDKLYGVSEEKYSEKIVGNAKDISAEWKVTRRLSDYFKIENKVEIRVFGLVDVEATIDGEKKKMNKGKVEVTITGVIVKDPESKWETSPFYRFTRDVYNKFIIPSRVGAIEELIKKEVIDFKEELKAYFEITGKR